VLDVPLRPGEAGLLAVRHPSGALLHPSTSSSRARAAVARAASTARFRVPVRRVPEETGRRGLLSKAVKVVVLKIAKAAVDHALSLALPRLAAMWEKHVWSKRDLEEGWFQVTPWAAPAPRSSSPPVSRAASGALLLVHGTFSNAGSGVRALAGTDFFERVRPLYGTRIYAFNHFTLSKTPEDNARQLLEDFLRRPHLDAITHSRGGLVLRSLVEHRQAHGAIADRFQLGHAVLVASPNDGTPLATPSRWQAPWAGSQT
jgi:hypothetical protein